MEIPEIGIRQINIPEVYIPEVYNPNPVLPVITNLQIDTAGCTYQHRDIKKYHEHLDKKAKKTRN